MIIIDLHENNTYLYKQKKYKYGQLLFNLLNYKFNNLKTNIDFIRDFKIYENEKDIESILNTKDIQEILNCFKNLIENPNIECEKVRRIDYALSNIIQDNISIFKETIYKVKIDNTTLKEYVIFAGLKDFIVYEISHFINSKRWASSCLYCHKLFFNNKQRHEQYCSKHCANKYNYAETQDLFKNFPLYEIFKKRKNRYYTRTTRYADRYNKDYYEDWLLVANNLKDLYIGGEIKSEEELAEFKNFLEIDPFDEENHKIISNIINSYLSSTT